MSKAVAAQMEQLKIQITQLRQEASLHREPISKVGKELMAFCETNKSGDGLVTGIPDSHNPFQEKKSWFPEHPGKPTSPVPEAAESKASSSHRSSPHPVHAHSNPLTRRLSIDQRRKRLAGISLDSRSSPDSPQHTLSHPNSTASLNDVLPNVPF